MSPTLLPGVRQHRHFSRRSIAAAVFAIASLAVAACSSSAAGLPTVGEAPPQYAAPTAGPSAAPSAAGEARDPSGRTDGSGSTAGGPATADQPTGPLIVRTGSLALEVKDLDAVLLQSRARIVGLGGY